jgi:hypothetical protein
MKTSKIQEQLSACKSAESVYGYTIITIWEDLLRTIPYRSRLVMLRVQI